MPARKRKRPRGVVDTSVLVAGIAGFKSPEIAPKNPSAKLLRDWIEEDTFAWLVSDEILLEYKRVLARLGVRRPLIGKIINLLREEAEFARARAKAGLPKDLVMYCARHDFGTYALSHTGNLAAVMKTVGHRDVKTAMQYQHPELESVRLVINDRNSRHNLRHKTEFLQ